MQLNLSFPAALFARLNGVVKPLVKAGFGSPFPVGPGLVVLETAGRKSGLPREVPLLAYRVGKTVTVSTGRTRSQWVRNLEVDDAPAVWIGGRRREATADVRRGGLSLASLTTG